MVDVGVPILKSFKKRKAKSRVPLIPLHRCLAFYSIMKGLPDLLVYIVARTKQYRQTVV